MDIDPARVVAAACRLEQRIAERFPESGLRTVAQGIASFAKEAAHTADHIARPNVPLRAIIALLLGAIPVTLAVGIWEVGWNLRIDSLSDGVSFFQVTVESFIFLGAGVFFLVSLETRVKRNRVLAAVHPLRVLAHRVDMHQLHKAPAYVVHVGKKTASSPERSMTAFELSRYLEYCCEMLSLIGKIAVFYGRKVHDPAAQGAVDQVEALTNGLSSKIWQKTMLLPRG